MVLVGPGIGWMNDPEDLDDSVCQDAQKVLKLTGNRDQEALDWLRQSVGDIETGYGAGQDLTSR